MRLLCAGAAFEPLNDPVCFAKPCANKRLRCAFLQRQNDPLQNVEFLGLAGLRQCALVLAVDIDGLDLDAPAERAWTTRRQDRDDWISCLIVLPATPPDLSRDDQAC